MRLDELLRERQAEAERRLAAHPGLRYPVEAIEHPGQVVGLDSRAIVLNSDPRLLLVAIGGKRDAALAVGVGNRVLKHMLDRFAQSAGIAKHVSRRRRDVD